ncbi:oxidized purine nucleoside triphosphate hydrolase-like [Mercenaria mercenaria]|uniref:oxidized purine nucleoside triphosphate hydrolase-like n=1 Tax=Mercenaria mercenaria TaxID=6596 RepID=UPI00234F51BA|nr:oxidized purine nucleoside triphosphate hydrolase-like [Mercenaria mercenaria]XP_045211327.2 oxidized purine nucleoside triphosphate hydrolase-like [Mercenaria mercenaria]
MVVNKVLTLVLIRQQARVLLGMKKRGFGKGRWNGFGGKVEPGETILQGAIRELKEEAELETKSLEEVGRLVFEFVGDPQLLEVHVFTGSKYQGQPKETQEMRPSWFSIDNIPFKEMWPDDILWFPLFLKGVKFSGYFRFEGHDKILDYTLKEVDEISNIK